MIFLFCQRTFFYKKLYLSIKWIELENISGAGIEPTSLEPKSKVRTIIRPGIIIFKI